MTEQYHPVAKEKWNDAYFDSRKLNDPKRVKQFALDEKFINKYISKGILCDVGCSTGEFLKSLTWHGEFYGIEISDYAKSIAGKIVSFEKNIFTEENFFDLVVFRGTIQHVDEPFRMIKRSFVALKPGGYICFLATPNSDSIIYKLKKNLAMLNFSLNFYIPGAKDLTNALGNFGFQITEVQFPYLETPYCSFLSDHCKFIANIFTRKFIPHPFWKSSMNIIAQKP